MKINLIEIKASQVAMRQPMDEMRFHTYHPEPIRLLDSYDYVDPMEHKINSSKVVKYIIDGECKYFVWSPEFQDAVGFVLNDIQELQRTKNTQGAIIADVKQELNKSNQKFNRLATYTGTIFGSLLCSLFFLGFAIGG